MNRASGLGIPKTFEEIVALGATALIVYDMQIGILRQLPHGADVLAAVLRVLKAARARGVPIFFMRHMSLPKRLAGVFQTRQMMMWQKISDPDKVEPWFLRDSPGFALAPELAVRPDEAILDKITMSAFEGTPLATALRDCGLTSFVICGVATEIGIEPTVRHGADLGLIPVVVEDACGAGHHEAGQRAIAGMQFIGDAVICGMSDLENAWSASGR